MKNRLTFILKTTMFFWLFAALVWLVYTALTSLLKGVVKTVDLSVFGLFFEAFLLSLIMLFFYLLFRRLFMAFITSCFLYLGFILANYVKIRMLDNPIYPADFFILGDLIRTWAVFIEYVPYLLLFLIISFITLRFLIKKEQPDQKNFFNKGLSITILLSAISVSFFNNESVRLTLKSQHIFDKKSANLTKRGLKSGFLTNFSQVLFFSAKIPQPALYTEQHIQQIVDKYQLNEPTKKQNNQVDHVIILMIEAFSDPKDFGWDFNRSTIPNFNSASLNHSSGQVISPVFGGRSVNAEFEFMTGFTNRFIPNQTNPFHQFINQDITGLPRVFKNNGYSTHAIQSVFFEGFGYDKVYDYLGVDQKISMTTEVNGYQPDPSGRSIDSGEIADKIIALTEQHKKSFIFSFPNSTHLPWNLSHYPETDLLLNNENNSFSESTYGYISAYGNALFHVDEMIGELISHFSQSKDKTLLVVFGDHQPTIARMRTAESLNNNHDNFINDKLNKYHTPLLLWTNYPTTVKQNMGTSLNLLPGIIVEKAGIEAKGLMKFNLILNEYFKILSDFIQQDGQFSIDSNTRGESIYIDYQMLQYDALFGQNYLYKITRN